MKVSKIVCNSVLLMKPVILCSLVLFCISSQAGWYKDLKKKVRYSECGRALLGQPFDELNPTAGMNWRERKWYALGPDGQQKYLDVEIVGEDAYAYIEQNGNVREVVDKISGVNIRPDNMYSVFAKTPHHPYHYFSEDLGVVLLYGGIPRYKTGLNVYSAKNGQLISKWELEKEEINKILHMSSPSRTGKYVTHMTHKVPEVHYEEKSIVDVRLIDDQLEVDFEIRLMEQNGTHRYDGPNFEYFGEYRIETLTLKVNEDELSTLRQLSE